MFVSLKGQETKPHIKRHRLPYNRLYYVYLLPFDDRVRQNESKPRQKWYSSIVGPTR